MANVNAGTNILFMLFTAKVVEDRSVGKILLRVGGIGFAFVIVCLVIPSLQPIAPFFALSTLLIVIVTAIIYRGNIASYELVNDLFVFEDGMQICRILFPYNEITQLSFEFQSYQHETDYRLARTNEPQSFGIGNNLSFTYRNQKFKYQFYLQNRQHYIQFVQMLEQLYEHQVSFGERNLKGKTFLMRNVNDQQLQSLKSHYHYK